MTTSTPDPTDETLVERIRSSPTDDLREFDTLVSRHRARVIANCRHLTRRPDLAEDLAQDVFLKAYFGLQRFQGGSTFRTWLQRIKINHCFDHLKREKGRIFVDADEQARLGAEQLQVPATAERDALRSEERRRLTRALEQLPDGLRIPLVLRDLDELAYAEIAETLGLTLSTVKMRILRGRRRLRTLLETTDAATVGARTDDDR